MIWYAAKVSVPIGVLGASLVEATSNATSDAADTQLKIAILSTVTGIVIALIGGAALVISSRSKKGEGALGPEKMAVMNEAHVNLIQQQAQLIIDLEKSEAKATQERDLAVLERDAAVYERDALREEIDRLRKQGARHGTPRQST